MVRVKTQGSAAADLSVLRDVSPTDGRSAKDVTYSKQEGRRLRVKINIKIR